MKSSGFPSCADCNKRSTPDCFIVKVTVDTVNRLHDPWSAILYPPAPLSESYPEDAVCTFHSKYEEMKKWGDNFVEKFKASFPEEDLEKVQKDTKVDDGQSDNLS